MRDALLSEIGQRLLLLYHRCVPSLVDEASYDIGKSLQSISKYIEEDESSTEGLADVTGFRHLRQLHVLSILREGN